jgi:hypothetical protein
VASDEKNYGIDFIGDTDIIVFLCLRIGVRQACGIKNSYG